MTIRTKLTVVLLAAFLLFFPSDGFSSEIKITASSSEAALSPENLLDGNIATRWSSKFSDNEWLEIDLGEAREISGLTLFWETAYASSYEILLSSDGKDWKSVYKQDKGIGGNEEVSFEKTAARYIKLDFKKRATKWGYSLFEISITGVDVNNSGKIDAGGIIPLEGKWDFRTDASKDWTQIETGRFWEDQGFPNYDGYAWYKKDILIPASWNDGKAALMVGGVDDAYELYVNGQFVAGYGPRVKNSAIPGSVNQTLTVSPVGKYLVPGKPNNFTFRVFDDWGGGGISKPPIVLVQDEDVVPQIKKRLDAQSYYQMKARPSERKYYPEWIGGRQAYWTVIGVEGDKAESCFC
ncbi:MAG: discoidin domain-containing protein, partial [Candidatus Omnitrophica bacterium]|nr:discoidin domain-containing protein [Candidatus Omnitrophota bacterium]